MKPASVDEYLAAQPAASQAALKRVRSAIRKALPGAEEAISYQIPTYKLHGSPVIYFAAWKQHYSLYPAPGPLIAAFRDELARYKVSRGTIRFPLSEPVPVELIERIAVFRGTAGVEVVSHPRTDAGRKQRRPAPQG